MEIMEITPPGSPGDIDSKSSPLSERGCCGFHCAGENFRKDQLHPQGFLISGDGHLADSKLNGSGVKQSFVTVFGQLYDIDSCYEDDLGRLFMIARNRLSLLESCQKSTIGTYGILTGSHHPSPVTDLNKTRQELREFYIMLRIFVSIESSQEESFWLIEQMLPTIMKGLCLLRTQLGWLSDLPHHVLSTCSLKGSKSTNSVGFHLFHCHLELRWLHISVLWILATWNKNCTSQFDGSQLPGLLQSGSLKGNLQELLQEAIELTLVDLIEMSVTKFNKLQYEQITQSSAFNCICVKELWLLLRFVLENSNHGGSKSFWKVVDPLFELLVKNESPSNNSSKKGARSLKIPSQISCTEPGLCSFWLLRHIAELFTYTPEGIHVDQIIDESETSHQTLKRIIMNLTDQSSHVTESQRRVAVSLLMRLYSGLWRPKPEPIMILLESFQRNLDCAFQISGALASSYVINSETVQEILISVSDVLLNKTKKVLNSFEMFLKLLSNYLDQDPSQWKQKMRGRFYSKLSVKRVDNLSEIGIYHLTQLFVVVALKTDLEEVGLEFQQFLSFGEKDEKRNSMVMKAQLCLLSLCVEKGKTLAPLVNSLVKEVRSFLDKDQCLVPRIFVENLDYVINSNDCLPVDMHLLVEKWVGQYLKLNHEESVRKLLNVMVLIMQKIQCHLDLNIVVGGLEKLVIALQENLLPYVKENLGTSLHQIADLAVHFTMLSLEFSTNMKCESFQDLLKYFMLKDSSNVLLVKKYLYNILHHNKTCNVMDIPDSQQILFIQAWVRCCSLSTSVDQDREKSVTEKILQMPLLQSMVPFSTYDLQQIQNSSDPLVELINLIGNTSNVNKTIVASLIEPLKHLVPVIISSLFPKKSKDGSWKEKKASFELQKDAIVRAYFVMGKLVCDCAPLVYPKNTTNNFVISVVNTLLIPPKVKDMEQKLPLAMHEGLRKSLILFLRGLHKLDPKKEACIQRFQREIIGVYIPKLKDAFVTIWDEPEHMSAAIAILQTVCDMFLQFDRRNNMPHKYYIEGLHFICELVKRNEADEVLLDFILTSAFPRMLEVAGNLIDLSAGSKRKETEKTLQVIFETEAYRTNPNLWNQTDVALSMLSEKYLSFCSDIFMRMLSFLIKEFKWIVKRFLPKLEIDIKEVIKKRGTGNDTNLEKLFLKLKEAVQQGSYDK